MGCEKIGFEHKGNCLYTNRGVQGKIFVVFLLFDSSSEAMDVSKSDRQPRSMDSLDHQIIARVKHSVSKPLAFNEHTAQKAGC